MGARLRAVLDRGAGGRVDPAEGPLDWADIIPAWSAEEDDVSPLGDGGRSGRAGGGSRASSGYPWDSAATPAEGGLSGEGAFGGGRRQWLHAFDPGRPGVRAMAAVAVVVVLVAGFLAWRSRPRVDEVVSDAAATASGVAGASRAPASGPVAGELVVAVGGKVRKPGLVRLATGSRVADALEAAGGAQPGVDVAPLNLARKVVDGELIMVGVTPPPGATAGVAATPGAAGGVVNLNTATLSQLDSLPGVGPVLAQRILDARDAQGGFRAITDLRKVDGIGDSRYEQLKDLVTV
ncbi:helix-hairpin-helix domain-containing protein [Actinoplanes subglobosus]|uniref:Helix-hairpin-helix domain-containing protein n=1 Tax=Actinoplanes subglobosus TaxID=1547892 RepID=A0ABV8JBF6_9ACTN